MRPRVAVSFLLCLCICHLPVSAQQIATPVGQTPQRDPQAIALFQQSIAAMGSNVAATQVQTVVAQGSLVSAPGSNAPTGTFTWEDQFGPSGHEFASTVQSGSTTQKFVSGHGSPGFISPSGVHNLKPYVANSRLPVHLPVMVLAGLLANSSCNISSIVRTSLSGSPALQIKVHSDTDFITQITSVQTWYFDPITGLPLRIEYRVPDNSMPHKFAVFTADFSDFRTVQGLAVPFKIAIAEDGTPESIITLSSVAINSPISTADFDLPTGGVN